MSEREWRFYLDDMIGFAERVLAYTDGFDQSRFETSGLTYDATVGGVYLVLWSGPLFFVHRERTGSRKNVALNYVAIYVVPNTPAMPLTVLGYAHFGGFFYARRSRA